MAWDSSRPVPWRRLLMLFAVYAVIATVALVVFGGGKYNVGTALGMLAGLVVYLALAYVLVKFGWNPPSLRPREAARESAERRAARDAAKPAAAAPSADRARPAPTRRTNATNRRARTTGRRR